MFRIQSSVCFSAWMDSSVNLDLLQNWTLFLSKSIKQTDFSFWCQEGRELGPAE